MSEVPVPPPLIPSRMVITQHPCGYVRLIEQHGTDRRIVEAARVSYGATGKTEEEDRRLLNRLYRDRHTSPFEMASITFNIKLPIFLMRQLVRHRTFRLNEFSARYKELPDQFYAPAQWRYQGDATNKQGSGEPVDAQLNKSLSQLVVINYRKIYETYQTLLEEGVSREQARMILPVGIYTECYLQCDLNNLLKFFSLRLDSHAQLEMQELAQAMFEITRVCFPWCVDAWERFRLYVLDKEAPRSVFPDTQAHLTPEEKAMGLDGK